MSFVIIPSAIPALVQPEKLARNNFQPATRYASDMVSAANFAARFSSMKEVFRMAGRIKAIPSSGGGGERIRWRFSFHTGPFCARIRYRALLAQQSDSSGLDARARLRVLTTAGTVVGEAYTHYGATTGFVADTPSSLGNGTNVLIDPATGAIVTLAPQTDYIGVWSDFDSGRLLAASVYEEPLDADTSNGYIRGSFGIGSSIYVSQRQTLTLMLDAMRRHGAAHTWNWTSNTDATAPAFVATTDTNIIDLTSTAVSSSTPGVTLDLRYRNTETTSTVAVRMRVYGRCTTAGKGHVRLKDASGTVMLDATGFGTADGWIQVDGTLPATLAKYDLLAAMTAGGTAATKATLYLAVPPEGNGSNMVLQARTAGSASNALTLAVASGGSPGTLSISNVGNATTLYIREASDFSHEQIEPLINASAALFQVLATDAVDTAWNQANGSLGGPWSFTGGADDVVTIKAVSIYELDP